MADKEPTTLEQARAAKVRAVEELAALPVVGIGITRVGDGYGLKVNLGADPTGEVPTTVAGVPVKVEVVKKIRKQ